MENQEKQEKTTEIADKTHEITCPECLSNSVQAVGRCLTCHICGWSACSI